MITIPTQRITVDGIPFVGQEAPAALELQSTELQTFSRPVSYDLEVSLINNGALVKGSVETVVACLCVRCLAQVDVEVRNQEVCHFYENPLPFEIDLTSDLREDILIDLPENFLCSDDCAGLCPRCGCDLNATSCGCEKSPFNEDDDGSTWGTLDKLKL